MKGSAYILGTAALAHRRNAESDSVDLDEQSANEVSDFAERAVSEARAVDLVLEQQMLSVENTDGGRTVDGGGPPLQPALRPFVATGQVVPSGRLLKSEIPGVADEDWTMFALAMKTGDPSKVSSSGELGMFAIKPRRLADFGLMKNLKKVQNETGYAWVGSWVSPMTKDKFLASPGEQYRQFVQSMRKYADNLQKGIIGAPTDGNTSLSGALAILHRCGPNGLKNWSDESARFPMTVALFERTNGIF